MKGCPNWLLHYSLFTLLSSLSPLGISQMSFMWNLPLGCERPLFLNDGRRLGCRAEELGQLTWPRGESLQAYGSHRNRTRTPQWERPWKYSAEWSWSWKCAWRITGSRSRAPLSSPYISVALLFEAFASFLFWRGFFWLTPSTISTFIKFGNLLVAEIAR